MCTSNIEGKRAYPFVKTLYYHIQILHTHVQIKWKRKNEYPCENTVMGHLIVPEFLSKNTLLR